MNHKLSHLFCVAPMIDWTDRHCRYFHRLLSQHALLYTEMITTHAIMHGKTQDLLNFSLEEKPVALQLGGSDPKALTECAQIGAAFNYDEINLNVGCPSDRVQKGRFGACLMAEPKLIAEAINNMQAAVKIPVTVKTRIGIDDSAEKDFLWKFVEIVNQAGCKTFIIHARKAWLKGLSPKENREIPPLNYPLVYELKKDYPDLEIIMNGGIKNMEDIKIHLAQVDGVMLGRTAYHEPYFLSQIDSSLFNVSSIPKTRAQIIQMLIPYWEKQMSLGVPLNTLLRPILGLWHGEIGARKIRQTLSNPHLSAPEKIKFLSEITSS